MKIYLTSDSRTLQGSAFNSEKEAQEWCDDLNKEHGLYYCEEPHKSCESEACIIDPQRYEELEMNVVDYYNNIYKPDNKIHFYNYCLELMDNDLYLVVLDESSDPSKDIKLEILKSYSARHKERYGEEFIVK